jgi:hypothetical protein
MNISLETVCYVINLARELTSDMSALGADESGKYAADDVLRDGFPEDDEISPAFRESAEHDDLREYIDNLNEDEQIELVAIAWIGRGTYTSGDWDEAVEVATDAHPSHKAAYLLGQPLLADELEEGLSELGLSCEDVE